MFDALLLEKTADGTTVSIRALEPRPLDEGEVRLAVAHSTLNYKDGLAITGRAPVVRTWPMVPGIDGAGTVLESRHASWQPGDRVVHNGWGVGETRWGCLAGQATLAGDGLVALPPAFSTEDAMSVGTAGYTAMLCLLAIERHGVVPGAGEVLVTGASGGVGSVAVLLLATLGHRVVASTGKPAEADWLRALGAAEIVDRAALGAPGKPLQKERWAAVVDAVGSHTLANALAQTRYGGIVAACGLAQGGDLPGSVMPFILRGVTLAGIDSVMAPLALRREAWDRLARHLAPERLAAIRETVPLGRAVEMAHALMDGRVRGRIVVRTGG